MFIDEYGGTCLYVKLACETSRRTAGSRRGGTRGDDCRGGVALANRKFHELSIAECIAPFFCSFVSDEGVELKYLCQTFLKRDLKDTCWKAFNYDVVCNKKDKEERFKKNDRGTK